VPGQEAAATCIVPAMAVTIRAARPGDGSGMARAWASAADYYADLDPEHFQRPQLQGLAESFEGSITKAGNDVLLLVAELDGHVAGWPAEAWGRDRGAHVARLGTYAHSPVSVPFYENRMGYERRAIIFQKNLG